MTAIHTLWDIIIRVPDYFIESDTGGILFGAISVCEDVTELGVLPVLAILICIYGFGREKNNMIQKAVIQ